MENLISNQEEASMNFAMNKTRLKKAEQDDSVENPLPRALPMPSKQIYPGAVKVLPAVPVDLESAIGDTDETIIRRPKARVSSLPKPVRLRERRATPPSPDSDELMKKIHEKELPQIPNMCNLEANNAGKADKTNDRTIRRLGDRCDNKRINVASLVHKLVDYPNVGNDAAALRDYHDCIVECLAALNALGINTTTWDPILIVMLERKLDDYNHLLYVQSLEQPKKLEPFNAFMAYLEKRFLTLEWIDLLDSWKRKN